MDFHFDALSGEGGMFFAVALVLFVAWFFLHLACWIAVMDDTKRVRDDFGETELLGGAMWSLAALLMGPLGLAIYWALNRSALHPRNVAPVREGEGA